MPVTLWVVAPRVGVEVESCAVMFHFLGGHFLFTSSDTFAVGCIVQPQQTAKKTNRRNFRVWNSHMLRGHVTLHGYSRRGNFGGSVL